MAVFTANFGTYALGTTVPGWTKRYRTDYFTAEVVPTAFPYSMGGNVLQLTYTSPTKAAALTCDALDNSTNVDILALGSFSITSLSHKAITIGGRLREPVAGIPIGYTMRPGYAGPGAYAYIYSHLSSTNATTVSSAPQANGYNDIDAGSDTYPKWVRFQIQGTTLRLKIWPHTHKEPAGWLIDVVDSAIIDPGWVGLFGSYTVATTSYYHYFAAATEGEPLLIPDIYNGDVLAGACTKGNAYVSSGSAQLSAGCYLERIDHITPNTYAVGMKAMLYQTTPTGVSRVARMAIYSGGASDTDPTGATLLADSGPTVIPATSAWHPFSLSESGTVTAVELPVGRLWLCLTTRLPVQSSSFVKTGTPYLTQGLNRDTCYYVAPAPYDTGDPSVPYPAVFPAGATVGAATLKYVYIQIQVGPASNFGVVVPRTASYTESLTLSDSTRVSIQEPYFFYEDLATFKSQLANRLNDPDMIYWTSDELLTIIHEALRTLSLLTWYNGYRLECTPNEAFQNLYTIDPPRLGMTMTDREMINRMQYDLMENITADWISGWAGTEQFNLADLTHALQKRRNRFLGETGAVITRVTDGDITLTDDGIIKIPDSIIDVRRVAWKDSVGYRNLWRVAEEEMTAFDPSWTTPAVQDPLYYSELAIKQAHMQLAPAPSALNDMELLTLSAGADFQPSLEPTAMGVNDDMAWIVKWGALAEILGGDNPARDPERAAYCEKRYQHGLQMANNYTTIIAARIGDTPIQVVTLAELDAYNGDWQKATPGAPQMVATAGLNYVAFYPPADGSTTISLDITRTAQLPWGDSDFIQLGRELYSPVLDYCVHLAMFKVGGAEFQATMPLLENFFEMCSNYNKRMEACSRLWGDMDKVTNAEEMTRLRTKTMGEPRTPENWGYGKPGGKQ